MSMKAKGDSRRPTRATKHILRLYIAVQDGKSRKALKNLKEICDRDLLGEYKIEIVDVRKNPGAAQENNLIALPAVVRTLPAPIRKFIGTFSGKDGSLVRVDLAADH
jgi:circadian clock protein KaiB